MLGFLAISESSISSVSSALVVSNVGEVVITTFAPNPQFITVQLETVSISTFIPSLGSVFEPNSESVSISTLVPSSSNSALVGFETVDISTLVPSVLYEIPSTVPSSTIYRCILTGAPDATTDLELPIKSFQSRYYDGADSYLSVVVPDAVTFSTGISDRSNGEIVLSRGVKFFDGTEQLVEIIRVDLEDISDSRGGSNRSITLAGHQEFINTSPKSVELFNATFAFTGTGKKRFRSDLDLNLRPGDTAVIGVESIIVDRITYTVDTSLEIMEITEQ